MPGWRYVSGARLHKTASSVRNSTGRPAGRPTVGILYAGFSVTPSWTTADATVNSARARDAAPFPPLGTLYGIGAGPGDPELMTIKGLNTLRRSPVVAFPAGQRGRPGLAEQIIRPWLQPHQKTLPLVFPYSQDDAALLQAWERAAAEVWPYLLQGKDVSFVSEGDVSFYSTFSYLAYALQRLQERWGAELGLAIAPPLPLVTIPGICSPLAAAAVVGKPLTLRQQSLLILPALYRPEALEQALASADVVVLMKIGAAYEIIWSTLQRQGRLEKSYIVERATWPEQVIHRDLGCYPQLKLPYFSIWVIPGAESPPPLGNFTPAIAVS